MDEEKAADIRGSLSESIVFPKILEKDIEASRLYFLALILGINSTPVSTSSVLGLFEEGPVEGCSSEAVGSGAEYFCLLNTGFPVPSLHVCIIRFRKSKSFD